MELEGTLCSIVRGLGNGKATHAHLVIVKLHPLRPTSKMTICDVAVRFDKIAMLIRMRGEGSRVKQFDSDSKIGFCE